MCIRDRSLAVGFAMVASFLLSSSLVPVLSVWWLRPHGQGPGTHHQEDDWVERLRNRLAALLQRLAPARGLLVASYLMVTIGVVAAVGTTLGREIFPVSYTHLEGAGGAEGAIRVPRGTSVIGTAGMARAAAGLLRYASGSVRKRSRHRGLQK